MKIVLWPEGAPLTNEGSTMQPSITAFLTDASESRGAVVVCPGGGYQTKAKHEGEPIARWLNDIGIHAFVLDYRVAGEGYAHPCALLDVQRAVRTVRHRAAEWNINPEQIAVLGFSAGGHLTAMSGVYSDVRYAEPVDEIDEVSARPDHIVLCYPVIYDHEGSKNNFVGNNPSYAELFALDQAVTDRTPPAFLWHTSDDPGVDVRNSLMFGAALREHRIPFELHVYEHGRHGLGLASADEHVSGWTEACRRWLRNCGY